MPKNIKEIRLWEDNPDKSRISEVVRIEFNFPCSWTILDIEDLKQIIKFWIIGEEKKYPEEKGFQGRDMLKKEIDKLFKEV